MNGRAIGVFLATYAIGLPVAAHPLGEAALDMEPGEWREIPTENMGPTMDTTNGGVPEYGDSGAWDPVNERFFIHGQGHEGGTGQFRVISFDAEANRWDALAQPGWYSGYPHQISHPYDHNAVDPEAGVYYMRPFQWDRLYTYDAATDQWGETPPIPNWGQYSNCCGGLVHFPEMDAMVLAATGSVVAYGLGSGSWSDVGSVPMGGYHNFAEYSPEEGAVILGGGPGDGGDSGATVIHRLDADGTLTELGPAPLGLGTTAAVVTVDPVEGTFLVLGPGGTLHSYDLASDAWGIESEEAPLPVFNTVAAPVSNHGVIMFANWDTGEPGVVYLYKASPFTPQPPGGTDDGDSGGEDDGGSTGSGSASTSGSSSPGSDSSPSDGDGGPDDGDGDGGSSGAASGASGADGGQPGEDADDGGGCSCTSAGGGSWSALLIAVVVAGWRRRRDALGTLG